MRSALYVLLAAVFALAAPVARADCERILGVTVSSGQLLQDIGKRRSNKPGFALMPAISCPVGDGWEAWGDVWNRFDKSGLRNNETDLEGSLTKSWGPTTLQLYAAYFDLPPQPFRVGVVQLYADMSYRVLDLDSVRVRLGLRPMQLFGTGGLADLTLLRARARVEMRRFLHPDITLSIEPSVVYNFTRQPGMAAVSFRPEIGLAWQAGESVSVAVTGKWANSHSIIEFGPTFKF